MWLLLLGLLLLWRLRLLLAERGRPDEKTSNLPLIGMFDQRESNLSFSFIECRFRDVIGLNGMSHR